MNGASDRCVDRPAPGSRLVTILVLPVMAIGRPAWDNPPDGTRARQLHSAGAQDHR